MKDGHFHFKHSYLNWRAIPCKRRNDLRFCGFFIIFSTFFLLDSLNFRLDSTRIFQVHDMTIIFFFSSFFHSHDLSTPDNDAYHRWPSKLKHLFSCEDCFERLAFWFKVVYIISVNKKGCGSKVFFEEWVIFDWRASRHWSRWSQCITILGFCFAHWNGLAGLHWQVWSCSKSWCIPNYQLSVPTKIYLYVCLIFEEFEKWVSKSGVLWPIA